MSDEKSEKPSTGWHGSLDLVFAERHAGTALVQNHAKAPLKVQKPFYPEGATVCHSVILHTAGGVVGGDHLSLNLQLQPNTHAVVTTAAAGKIYRSNGLEARQTIKMLVEPNTCLEWLPQETIVFNGAVYRQDLRVELALGAKWLGWEITRFGRSARGEKFVQGKWRSYTEIWQAGCPLWIDRQKLKATEARFNSPHCLGGQSVVGVLCWIGVAVAPEVVEQARTLYVSPLMQGEAGVTRLPYGLLCRYRGASTSEVRNWFTKVWRLLRLSYLGRDSCPPRVWQI